MLSYIKYVFIFCTFILLAETNFIDPTTTTGDGGSPNLSDNGQNTREPQIATDSTGEHVYAIWRRYDGFSDIIQVAISSDSGVTWINPTTTTGDGGSPNLSNNGNDAYNPQITTDSTGEHVYAIWERFDGSNWIIQVAISSNSGFNWINPTTTTGDGGSPNLSDNLQDAHHPQIATDSSGKYIYAIWGRYDGSNYIIQVAISTGVFGNFGLNWVNPTTTTGDGGSPNLSDNGRNADYPQITTNSTGECVYAIWQRSNGLNYIIQVAISTDSGDHWIDPTTTTGDGGSPNLSDNGEDAYYPEIATDFTGKHVYAIWQRSNGLNWIIQVAISFDSGDIWIDPTTTTGDGGTPNLSDNLQDAFEPEIATDSSGKYIYAIWRRYDGSNYIIQVAISTDSGVTWVNPIITTGDGGSPNLSDNGENALEPQIAVNSTGEHVYAIWRRFDGSNYIIQIANGIIISKIHFPTVIRPKRWTGSLLF